MSASATLPSNLAPLPDLLVARDLFSFAVGAVFERWTAMRLALADNWAGPDTELRVDDLADDVIALATQEYVRPDGTIQPYQASTVAAWLEDFFEEDCSADVEDGSIEEVAQVLDRLRSEIWQATPCPVAMWRQRCPQLARLVDQLRAERERRDHVLARNSEPAAPAAQHNQRVVSDEETGEPMDMALRDENVASSTVRGTGMNARLPIVDEEGFQLVQSHRNRHR